MRGAKNAGAGIGSGGSSTSQLSKQANRTGRHPRQALRVLADLLLIAPNRRMEGRLLQGSDP
jgi:hypothetical protein